MNKGLRSKQILIRYALLQVPPIALFVLILTFVKRWVVLPPWIFWGSIALWVLKDIILYPFVWRAYDWGKGGKDNRLLDALGVAQERLAPAGYVLVQGELWQARVTGDGASVEKGSVVRVRGIQGLMLFVESGEPAREAPKARGSH